MLLDEAYELDPIQNRDGMQIMADIMKAAEKYQQTMSVILTGYKDELEDKLFSINAGMQDRFLMISFSDFNENELFEIWNNLCSESGWTCIDNNSGIHSGRVAARRLSQSLNVKGFSNARSVKKLLNLSIRFAARRENHNNIIIVEDVIGKPPTTENIPELLDAMNDLNKYIGIKRVKESIAKICQVALRNYEKELNDMPIDPIPLNRLFLGKFIVIIIICYFTYCRKSWNWKNNCCLYLC